LRCFVLIQLLQLLLHLSEVAADLLLLLLQDHYPLRQLGRFG
jgi:hypothetical protein